jgi:arginine deiminase
MTEAILMNHIFHYHPLFRCNDFLVNATKDELPNVNITFEGGDILTLRDDTVLIGMSERTNASGIDYLIEQFKKRGKVNHVLVVILPKIRATIHLDMVFTMVDSDKAVVFPPLILTKEAVDVIHINIKNRSEPQIKRYPYLLDALKQVDINLEPIKCGGDSELHQKREQWQSGANFFTIAPGKMIGYGMNEHTFAELKKVGIPIVEAEDVINGKINLDNYDKYAIAISGNELTRGGGGARCMTMPVLRE